MNKYKEQLYLIKQKFHHYRIKNNLKRDFKNKKFTKNNLILFIECFKGFGINLNKFDDSTKSISVDIMDVGSGKYPIKKYTLRIIANIVNGYIDILIDINNTGHIVKIITITHIANNTRSYEILFDEVINNNTLCNKIISSELKTFVDSIQNYLQSVLLEKLKIIKW